MADHVDKEADVEPEERKADESSSGRDRQPRTNQLVRRLELFDSVHLRPYVHIHTRSLHSFTVTNIFLFIYFQWRSLKEN